MLNQLVLTEDPISDESHRFFSLLFSTSLKEVSAYSDTIKKNNDKLYDCLKNDLQKTDSCVKLQNKDPKIPMIGLHFDGFLSQFLPKVEESNRINFDENLAETISPNEFEQALIRFTKLMEFYFYNQAHGEKLPLQIKASFPFPHAVIVECHTALRFVVGLENEALLEKYVSLIRKVDEELRNFLIHGDEAEKRKLIDHLLDGKEDVFMKTVTQQIPKEGKEIITFTRFIREINETE
jgi:hypothetical protein